MVHDHRRMPRTLICVTESTLTRKLASANVCNMASSPFKTTRFCARPVETNDTRQNTPQKNDGQLDCPADDQCHVHLFECTTHNVHLENRWAQCLQESMDSSARIPDVFCACRPHQQLVVKQYTTVEQLCQKSQCKHVFTRHVRRLFHFSSLLLHGGHKSHSNKCTVVQP